MLSQKVRWCTKHFCSLLIMIYNGSFSYFLLLTYSIGNTSWVTSHSTLTWWLCCLMFGSHFHISPIIHVFVSLGHCIILICLTWWLSRLRVVFTSLTSHYPCCRCSVCIHLFKFTELFSTVFDFFLPETLLPQSSMSYDAIAMWCLISMTTTISVLILWR